MISIGLASPAPSSSARCMGCQNLRMNAPARLPGRVETRSSCLFFYRDINAVGFLFGRLVQADRKKSAAKSQRQLARGFFADVEVLVEPAAWRAEDAPFAPAKFDHFLAAARGVGLSAALL